MSKAVLDLSERYYGGELLCFPHTSQYSRDVTECKFLSKLFTYYQNNVLSLFFILGRRKLRLQLVRHFSKLQNMWCRLHFQFIACSSLGRSLFPLPLQDIEFSMILPHPLLKKKKKRSSSLC